MYAANAFVSESHLAWFKARLNGRRTRILGLLRRLTGFGPAGSLKLSVLAKFLRLLDDVADARDKEKNLLAQIETIEARHRYMRSNNRLKQATAPEILYGQIACRPDSKSEEQCSFDGFLKMAGLWYLFVHQNINHKKQSLTAD